MIIILKDIFITLLYMTGILFLLFLALLLFAMIVNVWRNK